MSTDFRKMNEQARKRRQEKNEARKIKKKIETSQQEDAFAAELTGSDAKEATEQIRSVPQLSYWGSSAVASRSTKSCLFPEVARFRRRASLTRSALLQE